MYSSAGMAALRTGGTSHFEDLRVVKRKQKIMTWITAMTLICSVGGVGAYVWFKPDSTPVIIPPDPVPTPIPSPDPGVASILAEAGFHADPKAEKVTNGYPSRILKQVGEEEVGFVLIRGGDFVMGHPPTPESPVSSALELALPPMKVSLSGFYMQENETSNRDMAAFLDSPDFAKMAESQNMTRDELIKAWAELSPKFGTNVAGLPTESPFPVSGIRHELAEAYAGWLGGKLPTEAQWEYTARSQGTHVLYPWDTPGKPSESSNDVKPNAVIDSHTAIFSIVGRENNKDRTVQGVYDLIGNVREWCRDRFMPANSEVFRTEANRKRVNPLGPAISSPDGTSPFVIRGGSFLTFAPTVSVYGPRGFSTDVELPETIQDLQKYKTLPEVGFRVVVEVKDAPSAP
jgi:serine/threonine-protein kinase